MFPPFFCERHPIGLQFVKPLSLDHCGGKLSLTPLWHPTSCFMKMLDHTEITKLSIPHLGTEYITQSG